MNIAVLSGKGGTGKTTVSTNLALTLTINYVDCDVEEPNGFIFLNPLLENKEEVYVEYPVIDREKCTLCGACVHACQFHALANAGKEMVIFEKLCHDCGACKLVCKSDAIRYEKRAIGMIEGGNVKKIQCFRGVLNISEPMAVPVIRKLLDNLSKDHHIVDCPPGTSCNVVNALRYADAAILVTEPSEFGLHDLKMAIELVKLYNIQYGIIINKDDGKENMVKNFCKTNEIALIGAIPYSMEAAALYSNGMMLCEDPYYHRFFSEISENMKEVLGWKS
jgi:MinD superfamily P-loop ATPase